MKYFKITSYFLVTLLRLKSDAFSHFNFVGSFLNSWTATWVLTLYPTRVWKKKALFSISHKTKTLMD